MLGLSDVSVYVMIMICILVATFMIDWHVNKNNRDFLIPTSAACVILLLASAMLVGIRSLVLVEYKEKEGFEDPLVVRNDTQDALLVRASEETMWVSRTFETTILPGDVAYFSNTTGYYRLLNTRKLDDSSVASRYDKLSKD